MLKIGCHLSASKGFYHMAKEAVSIGANTFQFFTRNPRGGKAKAIDEKEIALCVKDKQSPMFVRSVYNNNGNYDYLILPIRVNK